MSIVTKYLEAGAGLATITDPGKTMDYSRLLEEVVVAGNYLEKYLQNRNCACLIVQNTIESIILLLGLIEKKINFYIASPYILSSKKVPAFCDTVINPEPGMLQPASKDWITIKDTGSDMAHANSLFSKQSGMVLLASSGTSGAPKYIYYTAEKLLANAANCARHFGLQNESRVLVPLPVSHMYALGAGLLPAVCAGAGICLIDKTNVLKLLDKLQSYQPSSTLINPTIAKMMTQVCKSTFANTLFISAGEPLSVELYQEFSAKIGKLINLYGCTEVGVIATSLSKAAASGDVTVTPLDGVAVKIKSGRPGEVLCRSDHCFEYYINSRGKKVRIQPFENGWYKTNDTGVLDSSSSLQVHGRIDHCVNRSGFLLSLHELEKALENLLAPAGTQVITFQSNGGVLVGVIEWSDKHIFDEKAVRETALKSLPRHAVPDHFVFLKKIPRLHNGKPNRVSLIKKISKTYLS